MNGHKIFFEATKLALTRIEAAGAVDVSPATLDRDADCARVILGMAIIFPAGTVIPRRALRHGQFRLLALSA